MFQTFSFVHIEFLAHAALWTAALAGIALTGGGLGGLLVAVCRVSRLRAPRYAALGFIGLVQGTPLLVQLFLAYFGAAFAGLDVPPLAAAALAFTLYASAFFGDIWRGAIEGVPLGQWEAAAALGLGRLATLRLVIVPQAVKPAIPMKPTVGGMAGFIVQLVKNTALASIIGFRELTRAGQIVSNVTFQPLAVFLTVAAFYFVICYPISLASRRLEARLGRGHVEPSLI
jgi:polar amino acid transport system permease protein